MYENVHPNLAVVLLFLRTEVECGKGLLDLLRWSNYGTPTVLNYVPLLNLVSGVSVSLLGAGRRDTLETRFVIAKLTPKKRLFKFMSTRNAKESRNDSLRIPFVRLQPVIGQRETPPLKKVLSRVSGGA